MSERIDIFTLLPGDSPYFTVNTAVLSVPMLRPASVLSAAQMFSASARGSFAPGDNLTILSAGYSFPESFCLASAPANKHQTVPAFNIAFKSASTALVHTPNLGVAGIQLPLENYETPLGIFVDIYNLNAYFRTEAFGLYGTLRGIDELYTTANPYDPTPGLPSNPCIGDTYTATLTASGWTAAKIYQWNGSAWADVTALPEVFPQVSMVGAPSALNGKRIRVNVFVKVLHTLILS